MAPYTQVAENLKAAVTAFASAKENGCVVERDGLCLVASGVDFSVFNIAHLAAPLSGNEDALERAARDASEHFNKMHLRWSFWLCDDWLEAPVRSRARQVFLARRMRLQSMPPGMAAESLAPSRHSLPRVFVRRVEDDRTRDAFCHVTSVAFSVPLSVTHEIYGSPLLWSRSPFVGYVAYWNGSAVSTAATLTAAGVVGVYSVATLPMMQGRGFGEATMRHALHEAKRVSGVERTVLQSTPAGLRLYEQMGYQKVAQFSIYLSE